MAVNKQYIPELKVTQFWPDSLYAFRLEVPDDGSGIFLGNHVVDDIVANEMADTLREAGALFTEKYDARKTK